MECRTLHFRQRLCLVAGNDDFGAVVHCAQAAVALAGGAGFDDGDRRRIAGGAAGRSDALPGRRPARLRAGAGRRDPGALRVGKCRDLGLDHRGGVALPVRHRWLAGAGARQCPRPGRCPAGADPAALPVQQPQRHRWPGASRSGGRRTGVAGFVRPVPGRIGRGRIQFQPRRGSGTGRALPGD